MFDGRLNLSIAVLEEIKKYFATKLFKTPIPRSVKISEAPSHGLAITEYDRNGKGAAAYSAVALAIIQRCEG
jgi:chromosome partitioning protein